MKKQFLILFAFISVLALSQVPQRFNKVVVTGDIASPKFIKTGSNADSVLLGNGSARSVTSLKTDTVSLSNRINAKAAGNGTANGTNTGDETLTSIKTKLGAATPVSDGYLKYQDWNTFNNKVSNATHTGDATGSTDLTLATVNSNIGTFNNVTINAKGLATAGSNVSYQPSISGAATNNLLKWNGTTLINSSLSDDGSVTSLTKTSGNTVDLILNQSGVRGWHVQNYATTGQFRVFDGAVNALTLEKTTGAATFISTVTASSFSGSGAGLTGITSGQVTTALGYTPKPTFTENTAFNKNFGTTTGTVLEGRTFGTAAGSAVGDFQPAITGLTTNYIPKWNGSSFVNSLISDVGSALSVPQETDFTWGGWASGKATISGKPTGLNIYPLGNTMNGIVNIYSTTPSTSPTTGALVVGGGVGADHVRANNFYGNGSNLTGVQLPITLTTNGTSGAATFSGNVLNVPNYTSSGSFIQNQSASAQSGSLWVSGNIISNDKIEGITISTESVDINTSGAQINFYGTSGSGVLSQPFRGLNYKKVMIYLANFIGNNNINYLTAFTYPPAIVITDGLSSSLITSKSTTSVTITSASSATGILILEGY